MWTWHSDTSVEGEGGLRSKVADPKDFCSNLEVNSREAVDVLICYAFSEDLNRAYALSSDFGRFTAATRDS